MPDNDDDSEERTRKVLRNLPRVKAKPDFELRLARRLAEPGSRSSAIFGWLNITGRIPFPAYSAAALLVVAIVSYYVFFRSAGIPPPPLASDEISSASPSGAPASPQGNDELSGGRKDDDRDRHDAELRNEPVKVPPVSMDRKEKAAERAQSQTPVQQSQERGRTQQSAQGVSMSGLKKADKDGVAQESLSLPGAPSNVAPSNVVPGQKAFAPQAQMQSMKASPYAVTSEAFYAVYDSVHIKDSLRADSLRRAKLDSLKKK